MNSLFRFFFLFPFLSEVMTAVEEVVEDIDEIKTLSGDDKRRAIVDTVREALDELDSIPVWSGMSEEARDRILDGLTEISYQAISIVGDNVTDKARRRAKRLMRVAVKVSMDQVKARIASLKRGEA